MFPAYNPTTNDDGRRKQEDLPGRPEAIRRLEGEGEIRPRPIVYPLLNLPIFSGFPARPIGGIMGACPGRSKT
jgi:hypothetical protein